MKKIIAYLLTLLVVLIVVSLSQYFVLMPDWYLKNLLFVRCGWWGPLLSKEGIFEQVRAQDLGQGLGLSGPQVGVSGLRPPHRRRVNFSRTGGAGRGSTARMAVPRMDVGQVGHIGLVGR
jgi:hypothetical protein